jgi:hypothetical protein
MALSIRMLETIVGDAMHLSTVLHCRDCSTG